MKTNITIVFLTVCFIGLCFFVSFGWPLLTDKHSPGTLPALSKVADTPAGASLVRHYLVQYYFYQQYDIIPATTAEDQKYYLVAKALFVGAAALFMAICSLGLFLLNVNGDDESRISRPVILLAIALIVADGTLIRLILAAGYYGNYDMASYDIVTDIVSRGGNVYAETSRYNYSPIWSGILICLKKIQHVVPALPFHFIVRSFLCCIDLVTLATVLSIARDRKLPLIGTAIFFFLNPVSFLITGYHGQFENISIAMLLLGLLGYLSTRSVWLRSFILWIMVSAGMWVKHNIFYELIICLNAAIRRYWIKIPLFGISCCLFLLFFVPFWAKGSKGIMENVINYSSGTGYYGVALLYQGVSLKYLFIASLFLFPLLIRNRDIFTQCLLGFLFFLSFTTGIGVQYFIMPVAIGALLPSRGFFVYSIIASCFILGFAGNVFVPGISLLDINSVWLAVLFWFVTECRQPAAAGKKEYFSTEKISS